MCVCVYVGVKPHLLYVYLYVLHISAGRDAPIPQRWAITRVIPLSDHYRPVGGRGLPFPNFLMMRLNVWHVDITAGVSLYYRFGVGVAMKNENERNGSGRVGRIVKLCTSAWRKQENNHAQNLETSHLRNAHEQTPPVSISHRP